MRQSNRRVGPLVERAQRDSFVCDERWWLAGSLSSVYFGTKEVDRKRLIGWARDYDCCFAHSVGERAAMEISDNVALTGWWIDEKLASDHFATNLCIEPTAWSKVKAGG